MHLDRCGSAAIAVLAVVAAVSIASDRLHAQPAGAPALPRPGPELSGVLFTNFQYGGGVDARRSNKFDLERAYLTVRAALTEGTSGRVTFDVFQQSTSGADAFYRGWAVRAKYAYVQQDYLTGTDAPLGLNAYARLGMLQTVMVEHAESFWPRWIANSATERSGFFASADVGMSNTLTLPNRVGEVYSVITNGNGYTVRETDRFKDYGSRLTLTPLARRPSGMLRTLTISPWYYNGTRASDFASGRGTVRPVSEGRTRDRLGLFLGLRDPRLIVTAEIAEARNAVETADTLVAVLPTVRDTKGRLLAASVQARPLALFGITNAPVGIIARLDTFRPDHGVSSDRVRFVIAGVTWAVSSRLSLSLDYQELARQPYQRASDVKITYLHALATF